MFPIINIGPFAIQAPGLILILSIWFGLWMTVKFAQSLGTNGEVIENAILLGFLVGIVGARLGFFLQNPNLLTENPLGLFSLSATMLNTSFGLLIGLLVAFIVTQKNHLPLWPTLDTLTPLVLFLFFGIHLANLANGNQYGLTTQLPWGVHLWGAKRHPVQIYALLLTLVLSIWMLVKTTKLKSTGFLKSGLLFSSTIISLSTITVFTRAFVQQKIFIGPIDSVQFAGLIILAASLGSFYQRRYKIQKHISVFISLGSNLNPSKNIASGFEKINSLFKIRNSSDIYKTKDVNAGKDTADFLNQVIEIETDLQFPQLFKQLKSIESDLKRIPGDKKVVALDLDILTYNDHVFRYRTKHIPDPGLEKYRYIIEPLTEIAPDFRHPASGRSIQVISNKVNDQSKVEKIKEVENGT